MDLGGGLLWVSVWMDDGAVTIVGLSVCSGRRRWYYPELRVGDEMGLDWVVYRHDVDEYEGVIWGFAWSGDRAVMLVGFA